MESTGILGPVGHTVAVKFPSEYRYFCIDDRYVEEADNYMYDTTGAEEHTFNESTEEWEAVECSSSDSYSDSDSAREGVLLTGS
eukprot:SAG11_NODE_25064_length_364_cov_0.777358_1_plen_83_part_10